MDNDDLRRFGAHEQAIKAHEKLIDSHGRQIGDMRECIARLTMIMEQQQKQAAAMEQRLSALEAQPAEGWKRIKAAALTGAVSLIVGIVATLVTTGILS